MQSGHPRKVKPGCNEEFGDGQVTAIAYGFGLLKELSHMLQGGDR